jgi:DNA-binding PadR family transcriptional regulator
MAFDAGDTISFMESKIIYLAKSQYDHGIHGGTFTPGYVRKETGYEYRAIDPALDSLVIHKLLERSRTTTFRNGASVDIDLFRITEKGIQAFEKLKAGTIRVERELQRDVRRPNQRSDKPEGGQGHSLELHQSVKRLEATVGEVSAKLGKLHEKLDGMLEAAPTKLSGEHRQAIATNPAEPSNTEKERPSQPKDRKSRAPSSGMVLRRLALIEAVKELSKERKFILAEDLKSHYINKCKEKGIAPKGAEQFTVFLNGFKANRLISLKRTGCKAIGIEGRGSRLVVEMTPEGEEYLARNGTPSN